MVAPKSGKNVSGITFGKQSVEVPQSNLSLSTPLLGGKKLRLSPSKLQAPSKSNRKSANKLHKNFESALLI